MAHIMTLSRRTLLAAPLAAAPARAAKPDWSTLRKEFLLSKDVIYMNAANIAPTPAAVLREYHKQLADFQSNPAYQNREVYKTLSETVRSRLAAWVKAQPDEIAIARNTSEGNNLIAQGVRLKAGDEVLITAHNHPSNTQSWNLRAQQSGATVVVAPVPVMAKTPGELLDTIAAKITPRTRVIAVSHFTNTTGLLYPVREIAALARKNNAWFHVDGAQSFGWINLDLPALGMDSFTGSMHKWPMGPLESGLVYVRAARLADVSPAILSVDYWSDKPTAARKFETLGQRDDPRLRAIEKTMDFLEGLGAAEIEARAIAISSKLRDALRALPNADLRGSGEPAVSGPVIKVQFKGHDLAALYAKLWDRHRLSIAKTDSGDSMGLRFSPHVYNTEAEIDSVVAALKKV
jgi:isopenicillin-N epimerase